MTVIFLASVATVGLAQDSLNCREVMRLAGSKPDELQHANMLDVSGCSLMVLRPGKKVLCRPTLGLYLMDEEQAKLIKAIVARGEL